MGACASSGGSPAGDGGLGSALAVPPAGGDDHGGLGDGEGGGAPHDAHPALLSAPLASDLRRQWARTAAEALLEGPAVASDDAVDVAHHPHDNAPHVARGGMRGGCSPGELNALPTVLGALRARSTDGDVCEVCQERMFNEDTLRQLPCLHCLHTDCAYGWLEVQNECPACRLPAAVTVE